MVSKRVVINDENRIRDIDVGYDQNYDDWCRKKQINHGMNI